MNEIEKEMCRPGIMLRTRHERQGNGHAAEKRLRGCQSIRCRTPALKQLLHCTTPRRAMSAVGQRTKPLTREPAATRQQR
jgi:hypothetical protein